MPDMERDEYLQDVIHQLSTLPADVEEDDESFRQQFNDIRFKYPNQWVAYTEVWDESAKQSRLIVQGPFASMKDAVAWTKTLPDDQRDRFAIFYAAYSEANTYRAKNVLLELKSRLLTYLIGGVRNERPPLFPMSI